MTLTIDIEPMSPVLGARVRGVDLRNAPDERTANEVREAFTRYAVLCFPDQKITPEQQLRFANLFGRGDGSFRSQDKNERDYAATRGVMLVSNIRKDGKPIGALPDGEMQFHSDGAHRASPYRATTLYAIRVPSRGGETRFANLYAAYDTLPQATKDRIETLTTCSIYDYDATSRDSMDADNPDLPRAFHRLVKTHPDSGRKSLYLSRLMTRFIVDMDRAESDALLAELLDHAERPEFVYDHRWTPGDLLIWDNRCLNHARNDFPSEEQRLLRRYTVSEPDASIT